MMEIDIEWNTMIHKLFIEDMSFDIPHKRVNPKPDEHSTEVKLLDKEIPHFTEYIENELLEDITDYIILGDDRINRKARIRVNKEISDIIKSCPYDIFVNYGYRPLGMTCGNDIHGTTDATDIRGHWTGFALDLSMNENSKDTLNYLYDNDFSRPYNNNKYGNETWHFRYDGEVEKIIYRDSRQYVST